MKLLIVESPSKAKTIEKYLGKEYTVRASVGHVRDLPKSNKDAIDVEGGFVPRYEISPGKEKVLAGMKKLVLRADDVMLATDPDREGEAIAWHIKEALKLKNPKRVVFNEITQSAVQAAVANPRDIDEDLRKAQEARRVLDRLVGYDLSGLIWKKVRFGLSAGRVQSPALRILVEREREIRAFMPEDFWVLQALLETPRKEQVLFTCTEEPKTKDETDRILKVGRAGNWHVLAVEESEMARKPKAPFTTSTLQQSASSRLGMSPSRTMRVAQKLYEKGLISYMRTDSTTLGKDAVAAITDTISKKFGKASTNVGLEGGFTPPVQGTEDVLDLIMEALKKAGIRKAKIILDVAASTFFRDGRYYFEGENLNQYGLSKFYTALCQKYPIIGIEDPFAQDDWAGFEGITQSLGQSINIIGDDVLATNIPRIEEAQKKGACNALILKPNQAGTVTETIRAAKLALDHDWDVFVKHRSGETCDAFISDLAVGLGTGWLMAGAPNRGERVAKYNRVLMIEQELKNI